MAMISCLYDHNRELPGAEPRYMRSPNRQSHCMLRCMRRTRERDPQPPHATSGPHEGKGGPGARVAATRRRKGNGVAMKSRGITAPCDAEGDLRHRRPRPPHALRGSRHRLGASGPALSSLRQHGALLAQSRPAAAGGGALPILCRHDAGPPLPLACPTSLATRHPSAHPLLASLPPATSRRRCGAPWPLSSWTTLTTPCRLTWSRWARSGRRLRRAWQTSDSQQTLGACLDQQAHCLRP